MLFETLFFSFLAGFATLLGAFAVGKTEKQIRKKAVYLASFAAGVLLAAAFFKLLPKAAELNPGGWFYWALGAVIFIYLIEQSITIHSCREAAAAAGFLGFGAHAFIDGAIIAAGFKIGTGAGLLSSAAVIFHKAAEGAFAASLLSGTAIKKSGAAFFLLAAAAPAGALFLYFLPGEISKEALGSLAAAAAGIFIYIGASDLMPETRRKRGPINALLVLAGIAAVLAAIRAGFIKI